MKCVCVCGFYCAFPRDRERFAIHQRKCVYPHPLSLSHSVSHTQTTIVVLPHCGWVPHSDSFDMTKRKKNEKEEANTSFRLTRLSIYTQKTSGEARAPTPGRLQKTREKKKNIYRKKCVCVCVCVLVFFAICFDFFRSALWARAYDLDMCVWAGLSLIISDWCAHVFCDWRFSRLWLKSAEE